MIVLKLSTEEIGLAIKGLLELPAKESLDLILKIDEEAKTQLEEEKQSNSKNE